MIQQRINQLSDSIIKLRERKEMVDAELADLKEYIGTEKETDAVMERIRTLWADGRIFKEVHRERTSQLNGLREELGRNQIIEKVRKHSKWEICEPKGMQLKHNSPRVFFVQQEGDNKLYVLKIPRSIIDIETFRNEVKTALALNHPNILKVVDYSLGEYPYMVSPYYEGGTMAEADFDSWTDTEKETYRAIIKDVTDYVRKKGHYRMQDRADKNTFLMADKRTPVIGDLEHWQRR